MTVSALTLEQARQGLARCDKAERVLLAELDAHEAALVLEAKVYADATLSDGWPATQEVEERRETVAWARAEFQSITDRAKEAAG